MLDAMQELEKIHLVKGKKFLLKVETLHDLGHYPKFENIRNEIWGEPEDNFPSARNMSSANYFNDGTSLYVGAYREDDRGGLQPEEDFMVGFSYGFVGVKDKKLGFRSLDNLLFYSQFTGVKSEFHRYGLGMFLKRFQRDIVHNLYGINVITCTYDPLSGVNAYRNIRQFGMDVKDYLIAYYGDFSGNLNRADIPSDRFYVWWDLEKEREQPAFKLENLIQSRTQAVSSRWTEVQGVSGSFSLVRVENVDLDLKSEFVLIEIPYDYYGMLRETNTGDENVRRIPLDWRINTRKAFQAYLGKGYRIVDFRYYNESGRKRDYYILRK